MCLLPRHLEITAGYQGCLFQLSLPADAAPLPYQLVSCCVSFLCCRFPPFDQSCKVYLSCCLEDQRQQQKYCIGDVKHHRQKRYRMHDDPRRISDLGLIQKYSSQNKGNAGKESDHQRPVSVVKPVDGEGCSSLQPISSAFHRGCALHQALQKPCDQDGEQADRVDQPSKYVSIARSSSDSPLGDIDASAILPYPGDHPQEDGDKQGQGRGYPSKQINDLICGKQDKQAADPHKACRDHDALHGSIGERLQRDLVPDKVLPESSYAKVIVEGIPERIGSRQRHQNDVEDQRLQAADLYRIQECADIGDQRIDRMTEPDGAADRDNKIDQVYRRMIAVKSHWMSSIMPYFTLMRSSFSMIGP